MSTTQEAWERVKDMAEEGNCLAICLSDLLDLINHNQQHQDDERAAEPAGLVERIAGLLASVGVEDPYPHAQSVVRACAMHINNQPSLPVYDTDRAVIVNFLLDEANG